LSIVQLTLTENKTVVIYFVIILCVTEQELKTLCIGNGTTSKLL